MVTYDELKEYYINKKMSIEKISKLCNIPTIDIKAYIIYYNMDPKYSELSKDFFLSEYIQNHKSLKEISKIKKINTSVLSKLVKLYDLYKSTEIIKKEKQEKIKRTNLEKYGCESHLSNKEIRNKIKETNLKKYGCESHLSNKEIRNKIKETNLEKYGCENPFSNINIISKIKETNLEKYGCENPIKRDEIRNKIKETNLEKYGCENPMQNNKIKEKSMQTCMVKYNSTNYKSSSIGRENSLKKKWKYSFDLTDETLENIIKKFDKKYTINEISEKIGLSYNTVQSFIKKKKIYENVNFKPQYSKYETEIVLFLNSIGINNIKRNIKNIISPYEIDIYLPEYNIAIEFNGCYWHSTDYKNKNYHYNKYCLAKLKGIYLFHIFENDWIDEEKNRIIKQNIKNIIFKNNNKYEISQIDFLNNKLVVYSNENILLNSSFKIKNDSIILYDFSFFMSYNSIYDLVKKLSVKFKKIRFVSKIAFDDFYFNDIELLYKKRISPKLFYINKASLSYLYNNNFDKTLKIYDCGFYSYEYRGI